jgi:hypothetical protein
MTIETKYNVGDKVWSMKDNKPQTNTIDRIRAYASDDVYIEYEVIGSSKEHAEHELFPSKQDLLNSL